MFKVYLSHLKYITGVRQKHIASFSILCHVLVFTFLEGFQLRRIIAFYPAGLIKAYRFPATGCIVFIQQTILNDLKLQLSYRTYNLAAIELIDTPSSINWSIPFANCFCFIGSAFSIYLNISGEKLGNPRK